MFQTLRGRPTINAFTPSMRGSIRSRARALERRDVVTRYYRFGIAAAAIAAVLIGAACRPSGPRVFFVQPQDGATVKSPVKLEFDADEHRDGLAEARARDEPELLGGLDGFAVEAEHGVERPRDLHVAD